MLKLLHFVSAEHLFYQRFVKNRCLFVTKIVKLVACQKRKKTCFPSSNLNRNMFIVFRNMNNIRNNISVFKMEAFLI